MCGVRVRTMSVCWTLVSVLPNRRRTTGMSESPGTPLIDLRSSSRMRPASRLVSWSFRRMVVSISRVPIIGWDRPFPADIWPASDETSTFSFSVISLL